MNRQLVVRGNNSPARMNRQLVVHGNANALALMNRANRTNLSTARPRVRFSRTKRFVRAGAKNMVIFAAVTGLETLLPSSFMPGLVIQLCLGAPAVYNAVSKGRPNLAFRGSAFTTFWYIAFRGIAGIRETMIITQKSTLFTPVTNAVGRLIDKHVRGSANSKSVKYAILYYIAQFIRAYLQAMKYPVYDSANEYGRRFASTYSGHAGKHILNVVKFGGKTAFSLVKKYPRTSMAAGGAAIAYMRSKKNNNSPRRNNNSPRRNNNNSPRRLTSS